MSKDTTGSIALRRSCAFVLEVAAPLKTLCRIAELLGSRGVNADSLQLYPLPDDHAVIIFHCRIEKDRIRFIAMHLEKMKGVKKVSWMDEKTRNKFYT